MLLICGPSPLHFIWINIIFKKNILFSSLFVFNHELFYAHSFNIFCVESDEGTSDASPDPPPDLPPRGVVAPSTSQSATAGSTESPAQGEQGKYEGMSFHCLFALFVILLE